MTVEFEGIPYPDTFAVEVRWVASREETISLMKWSFVDFSVNSFL
jgi:hypothetical protein